jgi:hypothetical protein
MRVESYYFRGCPGLLGFLSLVNLLFQLVEQYFMIATIKPPLALLEK